MVASCALTCFTSASRSFLSAALSLSLLAVDGPLASSAAAMASTESPTTETLSASILAAFSDALTPSPRTMVTVRTLVLIATTTATSAQSATAPRDTPAFLGLLGILGVRALGERSSRPSLLPVYPPVNGAWLPMTRDGCCTVGIPPPPSGFAWFVAAGLGPRALTEGDMRAAGDIIVPCGAKLLRRSRKASTAASEGSMLWRPLSGRLMVLTLIVSGKALMIPAVRGGLMSALVSEVV